MDERERQRIIDDLPAMRARFFKALEDPSHIVWDRLLLGIPGRHGRFSILTAMYRHPFGHDCRACREWRNSPENKPLVEIEKQVLARRAQRRASLTTYQATG